MPGIDPARAFRPLKIAVLTVSDSRTAAEDRSGDLLVERLRGAGHELADRALVPDEIERIVARLRQWIEDPAVEGFGKIGTSALQSRATAGVAGDTYLFALPGSPGACRDGWDEILVHQLDIRFRPCNFAELLPRLGER